MKEETRKTLGIWLLGIGIGISILKHLYYDSSDGKGYEKVGDTSFREH